MALGLIRKIHLKNSKVIHREPKYKPQPSIQTKMKIGLSAACDFQLFSRTSLIYGNETCLNFSVWVSKTHTVSDRYVMTFFREELK